MYVNRQNGRKSTIEMSGIGVLNEKPLHASLKEFCAHPGDRFEVPVDGFVIDIVRGDQFLEIQTGNFASMKSKLKALLPEHRIRLIYPIPLEKWLIKHSGDRYGRATRRKSPKSGRLVDLFWEMVSIPHLLSHPNFSLEVLLTKEEEVRTFDGRRRWRKKGWATIERRLLEVADRRLFEKPADWRTFIPVSMGKSFTTGDLSESMRVSRALAQKIAYCLSRAGVIENIGRRGRANLYEILDEG